MSHNRLDYISLFKERTVEKMSEIRSKFIELESEIVNLKPNIFEGFDGEEGVNVMRVFKESLKHLEVSQMYAIKLLCLLGEVKPQKEKE